MDDLILDCVAGMGVFATQYYDSDLDPYPEESSEEIHDDISQTEDYDYSLSETEDYPCVDYVTGSENESETQPKRKVCFLIRNYICNICDDSFRTEQELIAHTHTSSNLCNRCGKSFGSRHALYGHMSTHKRGVKRRVTVGKTWQPIKKRRTSK